MKQPDYSDEIFKQKHTIFRGECLLEHHKLLFLELFCKIILDFLVIVKSIRDPEGKFRETFKQTLDPFAKDMKVNVIHTIINIDDDSIHKVFEEHVNSFNRDIITYCENKLKRPAYKMLRVSVPYGL